MANRFTDTTKWSEDWYCELGGEYQLFWDFITDMCDNAGVWKPNKMDFEIKTKFKVNLDSFFEKVNSDRQKMFGGAQRILLLDNGRWFLPGFISYQWFNKKETFDLVLSNRLHKSLYEILLKNKILLKKVRGLKEVLETSMDMEKVFKEEVKERGVGKGKGEGFFCNEISKDMELTNLETQATKEFIQITVKKIISDLEIKDYWKAFKINQFAQKEWYNNREQLIKHFRHSLKLELQKQKNGAISKQSKQDTARINAIETGKREFADLVRKSNTGN